MDTRVIQPDAEWQALLNWRSAGVPSLPGSLLHDLYAPLCHGDAGTPFAVGHLAQSLDGRIATAGGNSQWLSGDADLLHTHRMRALFDAVVVGANTVLIDDPQLTVRHCTGPNPVRVVIDPSLRLDGSQRVFRDGLAPTLVLATDAPADRRLELGEAEIVCLPGGRDGIAPRAILRALAERGLARIFIEGGGITVSRFLAAGALDRLQLTVAPVILGSGRPAVRLPEIEHLHDGLRPRTRRFDLGDDLLFECDFGA